MVYPLFSPLQTFSSLTHRPQIVDLTVEDNQRLKVIYGSSAGFHAIDLDSATVQDIHLPSLVSRGKDAARVETLIFENSENVKYVVVFFSPLFSCDSDDQWSLNFHKCVISSIFWVT